MTLRIAGALIALALSAGMVETVQAGDEKQPRPIDSPIVRPKLREDHKIKPKLRANNRYERVSWGSEWKVIFHRPVRGLPHYLR